MSSLLLRLMLKDSWCPLAFLKKLGGHLPFVSWWFLAWKGLDFSVCVSGYSSHINVHIGNKKFVLFLLKIGQDHILWERVDSFKEETKIMVMGLTEGLQIEIGHLLSHLHQHIKKIWWDIKKLNHHKMRLGTTSTGQGLDEDGQGEV